MPCRLSREEVVSIQVLSEKQVPKRQIARQLGVTEGTVRYHLRRKAAGAEDGRRGKAMRVEPLANVIDHWWSARATGERPPNIHELHDMLEREHGYAGSYKSVLRYVRRRFGQPRVRAHRRVETVPGAQSQTDWGEYPRVVIAGEPRYLYNFAMSLSHCRKPAMIWSESKDQLSWIACHNAAFERLGGVAAVNRIDNDRAAIGRGAGAWGQPTAAYAAYARTMRFHIDACGARKPWEKGKVEAKVKLGRRILKPTQRQYDALEELQEETDQEVDRWARRAICPATGLSVQESWERERELLGELPATLPQPFDVVVHRPVQHDCGVHFEGRQYAVPFQYVGRTVEVRGCAGVVQIYRGGALIGQYERHTATRILIAPACFEGESTDRVIAPPPLGKLGRRLQEIYEMPVESRPIDLYAAVAEAAR